MITYRRRAMRRANSVQRFSRPNPSSIGGWLEPASWFSLLLMPMLWLCHGPAVSLDQTLVRAGLVALSSFGALVSTGPRLVRNARRRSEWSFQPQSGAEDG